VGLRWGRGRYYLYGWLLFPALAAAAMGLAVLTHQAEFDRWMAELMMRIGLTYPNQPLDPDAARIGIIVFSFTLGMIPTALAGLVTEFAWRGYLLMRLLPRVGTGRALVLTGAISGVWMAPFVLLPNRLTPYLYPEHPLLGVALMVGFSTLSGVVLGWLRLASGSLFPAAVGVGAMNGPARTALFFLRSRDDVTTGLTGLLGQAMLLLVIVGLWRTGALQSAFDTQGEDDAREPLPQQGQQ
jgi:membrane protease YdiL (CAAX protease family)